MSSIICYNNGLKSLESLKSKIILHYSQSQTLLHLKSKGKRAVLVQVARIPKNILEVKNTVAI